MGRKPLAPMQAARGNIAFQCLHDALGQPGLGGGTGMPIPHELTVQFHRDDKKHELDHVPGERTAAHQVISQIAFYSP